MTSRGNEKRDIVRDDDDRRRFVGLLGRVVTTHRWLLHAWVLMDNHYHLLVETPFMGLSRGVKWLNQRYAEVFNERHGRVGHLFQGRYKGILVEREGHLLELVRYIVLNPVRSGMVVYAGDYKWSNYRGTAGLKSPPPWLEIDWTLSQFGVDRASAHEGYRRFVSDGRGATYRPWETLQGQIYLGSSDFRTWMQTLVEEKERSTEHPRPQYKRPPPALERIVAAVAEAFGETQDEMRRKCRTPARKAFAQVATEFAALPLRQIGEWLRISDSAASRLSGKGLRLYETTSTYRSKVDQIRNQLSQESRCDP